MDDPLACPGKRRHLADGFHAIAAAADEDALRLSSRQFQHIRRNALIKQDDVGRLQRAHRLDRQEFGLAGPRAHEGDMARSGMRARGLPDEIDRLVEQEKVDALKLYPADLYDSDTAESPYGELREFYMDDREVIFPVLERARQHGLKSVAIHKAIPLGPVPIHTFKVEDLDAAFMAFPDLNIEIVHGGFAFLEETAYQVGRFHNAWVNLEATSQLLANAPRRFAQIIAAFLGAGAEDRIVWGTGAALSHPQPLIERFWDVTFSEDIMRFYGVPQITDDVKRKILGQNAARLHDLDLEHLRKVVERDDPRARGLAQPWSVAA
jgi:uncharacterized protein